MKIMLFGSTGMLGSRVKKLLEDDKKTTLVCPTRRECNLADRIAVAKAIEAAKPEVIINCAAYTAVDDAEKEGETAALINDHAPRAMAGMAKKLGALLIHISTDYVFDGTATEPYREDAPTAPLGTYGQTKLSGEQSITATGCRHIILRTQWLYAAQGKNFFNTMLRLFGTKEQVGVVADQRGCPTFAPHLAEAVAAIARCYKPGQPSAKSLCPDGIYHYADAGQCTWYDFAQTIAAHAVTTCDVRPITTAQYPTPARRPAYSVLDCSKFDKTFGETLGLMRMPWRAGVVEGFIERQEMGE